MEIADVELAGSFVEACRGCGGSICRGSHRRLQPEVMEWRLQPKVMEWRLQPEIVGGAAAIAGAGEEEVHERFPFSIAFSEQGSVLDSQNGEAHIQHSTIVFPKGSPIPSTNCLPFFRSDTFSIHVMYTGTSDLHVPNISKYSIGPFQTSNVEGARFQVKICLNIHGIITVELITAKTPKKKLNIINMPVSGLVYGTMTSQEVHRAKEAELVMTQQDRVMEERKDMKNAVKAYVYNFRNKLDIKYHDVVSAEEKELLCIQLQEVEAWLYEDGDDVTMEAYAAKLEELKKQGGKVEKCFKNWTQRELAIRQLKVCIDYYFKLASRDIRRFDHIRTEEKQKIIDACGEANMLLHEKIEQHNLFPKYVVPTLRAADVRSIVESFRRFCGLILMKPRRAEQKSLCTAGRKHPLPDDIALQPKVGDVAVDPQPVAGDIESDANATPMDIENTVDGAIVPTQKHVYKCFA